PQIRGGIIPSPPVSVIDVEGAKHVVECAGLQIKFTDERTEPVVPACAPVPPPPDGSGLPPVPGCIPALGTREELSFGRVSVQQAVNAFAGGIADTSGGAPTDVAGQTLSNNPGLPDVGAPSADLGAAVPAALNQTPFPSSPPVQTNIRNPVLRGVNAGGFKLLHKNLAEVAAL